MKLWRIWNLKLNIFKREINTMVWPCKENGKNKNNEKGITINI
jgi:hypothetical protein